MSLDIRKLIIKDHLNAFSAYKIAEKFSLARSTVQSIINLYKNTGKCKKKKNPGRPKIATASDLLCLKRIAVEDSHASAADITIKCRNFIKKDISVDTCKRMLQKIGFKFYKVKFVRYFKFI